MADEDMARVRFDSHFLWRPHPRRVFVFTPGTSPDPDGGFTVPRRCADAAIAAGKGVELVAPPSRNSNKVPAAAIAVEPEPAADTAIAAGEPSPETPETPKE